MLPFEPLELSQTDATSLQLEATDRHYSPCRAVIQNYQEPQELADLRGSRHRQWTSELFVVVAAFPELEFSGYPSLDQLE